MFLIVFACFAALAVPPAFAQLASPTKPGNGAEAVVMPEHPGSKTVMPPSRLHGVKGLSPDKLLPLTAAQCTGIGGVVNIDSWSCKEGSCSTVDSEGVIRRRCLSKSAKSP